MLYVVKMVYLDGKDIDINVEKEKIDEFFDELKEKKIYWTEDESVGFWLDIAQIRYIQFFIKTEDSIEEVPDPTSSKEVSQDDEDNTEGEG